MSLRLEQLSVFVLDWAKIRFSGFDDFTHIRNHTDTIGAIGAVKFRNPIQVLQLLSIKNDEVLARKLGDAVDGKTSPLIERHAGIEQHDGKHHAVDDGARDEIDGA